MQNIWHVLIILRLVWRKRKSRWESKISGENFLSIKILKMISLHNIIYEGSVSLPPPPQLLFNPGSYKAKVLPILFAIVAYKLLVADGSLKEI